VALRAADGRGLSQSSQALALSGFALAWGVCTTEFLLKPFFQRVPPAEWFAHGTSAVQWFSREDNGSFPSGHAAQLAAVGTILWSAYRRWRWIYVGITLLLSAVLVAGNWHYVSDVIAGLFVGVTAGLIVQGLWDAKIATQGWLDQSGMRVRNVQDNSTMPPPTSSS
jgi:membrane-associated phospholipid phosphatase